MLCFDDSRPTKFILRLPLLRPRDTWVRPFCPCSMIFLFSPPAALIWPVVARSLTLSLDLWSFFALSGTLVRSPRSPRSWDSHRVGLEPATGTPRNLLLVTRSTREELEKARGGCGRHERSHSGRWTTKRRRSTGRRRRSCSPMISSLVQSQSCAIALSSARAALSIRDLGGRTTHAATTAVRDIIACSFLAPSATATSAAATTSQADIARYGGGLTISPMSRAPAATRASARHRGVQIKGRGDELDPIRLATGQTRMSSPTSRRWRGGHGQLVEACYPPEALSVDGLDRLVAFSSFPDSMSHHLPPASRATWTCCRGAVAATCADPGGADHVGVTVAELMRRNRSKASEARTSVSHRGNFVRPPTVTR
jgi:hypothetical protein